MMSRNDFRAAIFFWQLLFWLPGLLAAQATAAESITLAEGGMAKLPVVISEKASPAVKQVADELAGYLGRIAGAKFAVETGDGSRGIVLGTLAEFPQPELNEPLALRQEYDGREAFAIRTQKDRLLLIGGSDLGASHAAFRLLEALGCRWFFPAEAWEVVPSQPQLKVSIDETDRPKFLARRIWYGYGAFNDRGHPRGSTCLKDYETWSRHNRMASSFRVSTGHAWQGIILDNKQLFAEHPEYLALVKGERKGEQLCVSNPAVRELAVAYAMKQIAKSPDREMVSMECSDGYGQCECDECRKLGGVSDRVFGLANHVAKQVQLKHPGKMVGCLAYSEHSEPPSFSLEPNVYVQLTAGFIRGQYTWDELVDLWPQRCARMGFYEYYSVYLWDFDKLPGGRGADIDLIRQRIQRYASKGATSFDAESGNNWGVHGRGYLVTNRLLWHPEDDVEAILTDFYDKAFGPGAAAMRRYYDRWSPSDKPLMSRSLMGELFRDLDEAALAANDRPDVLTRLDQLKHYLRFTHLRWLLDHEKDQARQKELTVELLTLAYRTRYEYMNHWTALMTTMAGDAAKKFNEPGWIRGSKEPKPWQVDTPVTREETDRWFREGLDYFQPLAMTVAERTFQYDQLMPSGIDDPKPAALNQGFQSVRRYAVASADGQPIKLDLIVGVIAWYRDRADAKYKLTDAAGKTIVEKSLKLTGEVNHLELAVPAAGTYFFECHDSGSGWRIQAAPGTKVTLLPQRGERIVGMGQFQRLYFYVPPGTKTLQYFWKGGVHKVLGPDGKPLAEVTARDEVVSVPVPAGADGQCWSFSPTPIEQVWLFNAPNCLAPSPSSLLLPAELMKQEKQ